jgi:hypothetical protein
MTQSPNNNKDLGKQIIKIFQQLAQERSELESTWHEAYQFTAPLRGRLLMNGDHNSSSSKLRDNANILDSTASESITLLASSIMSGITPSASQWFTFKTVGNAPLPHDAKVWLEKANTQLMELIHNSSNYNAEVLEAFEDMAIVGMFGLFIKKIEGGNFIFELWPLDSIYVIENPQTKMIDQIYRVYTLTVSEAVDEFGLETLPTELQSLYKNTPDDTKKHEFIHCIKPRKKRSKRGLAEDMPIASIYVHRKSGQVVRESGYEEFPVAVPRWSKIPGTPYAVGPTHKALPDIKTLNKIVYLMMTNAEMAIAGTFAAKMDGYLNPASIQIGPRKVVFMADVNNLKPLTAAGDFRISFEEISRLQRQIKSVMMSDELEPISKNYASATEVATRSSLIRAILGPIFARMQSEFLEPLLTRCFNLALRDGSFGPIPESLAGITISPTYTSPMARAQRMEDVSSMDRFEMSIAQSSQLNPGVLDIYNFDEAARMKAYLLGVPSSVLRSTEHVNKMRAEAQAAAEAQAQQEQQAAMMSPEMLKTGIKAMDSEGIQKLMGGNRG